MKKYVIIALILLTAIIVIQQRALKRVKSERNIYKGNTYALMSENQRYRTKDSLNAISASELKLTLKEYKEYRQKDAETIRNLKSDNKRLQSVTTAQMQTIYSLRGQVRDSIVYRDRNITDTLRCIEIVNTWFTLNGCTNRNKEFTGQFISRDSLLYVEHIVPKRFLFFKWGVKERKQEIVSRNPYTVIESAEFITIRSRRRK